MTDYTTLVNIKARLANNASGTLSTSTADDAFISALITRASAIIDQYTDQHFTAVSATRYFDIPRRNPRRLLLDDWLLSCTSVTNGNGVVIPATEYILEDYNNPPYFAIVMKNTSSYYWMPDSGMNDRKCIAVAGSWGWSATAPNDVVEACERLVVGALKSRDGVNMTGKTVITPAGVVQSPLMMTDDVKGLLSGYKKIVLSVGGW